MFQNFNCVLSIVENIIAKLCQTKLLSLLFGGKLVSAFVIIVQFAVVVAVVVVVCLKF